MLKEHTHEPKEGVQFPKAKRIALVVSLYNREVTERLEKKCIETLEKQGFSRKLINILYVPGAFEIPLACQRAAQTKKYAVIIALGVIIKGETHHFELIANECARGIMDVMLQYNIPIVFEVLAGKSVDLQKRAGGNEYNKGIEAANAALQLLK